MPGANSADSLNPPTRLPALVLLDRDGTINVGADEGSYIVAPAEVRRIDGRLEVRTGERKAPTQVHRTERKDGGETADFY